MSDEISRKEYKCNFISSQQPPDDVNLDVASQNVQQSMEAWFKETMVPVEPYKFPSITVIDRDQAIEYINAWFSQRKRVINTETDEEVIIDVDIHSDSIRIWLIDATSGGWISDDEVTTIYKTKSSVCHSCLTGETK